MARRDAPPGRLYHFGCSYAAARLRRELVLLPLLLASVLFLVTSGCASRSSGTSSGTRLAIDLLRGSAFEPLSSSIEFTNFRPVGSSATAEGKVTTGFRFHKERNRWVLKEVRLGDGQWESVQDLKQALDDLHARRTRADMREIMEAGERYKAATGSYPAAADLVELIDRLHPGYLARVIRLDGWRHELRMRMAQGRMTLASDGADGKEGTPDDIRMP